MITASQWILIMYFGYTSQAIGGYTTEKDCEIARQMAQVRWKQEFEGRPKGTFSVCLPIGTIVSTEN